MYKTAICSIVTTVALAGAAFAGDTYVAPKDKIIEPIIAEPCIPDSEWTIDLFGAYAVTPSDQQRIIGDHAWGGGIGINYFFARYFGVGVEGMALDPRHHGDVIGDAAVNFFLRLPLEDSCIAPYAFIGLGAVFNANDVRVFESDRYRRDQIGRSSSDHDALLKGHAGLGIEYRIVRNVGLFTDARWTVVDHGKNNYGTARAGVRIAF